MTAAQEALLVEMARAMALAAHRAGDSDTARLLQRRISNVVYGYSPETRDLNPAPFCADCDRKSVCAIILSGTRPCNRGKDWRSP